MCDIDTALSKLLSTVPANERMIWEQQLNDFGSLHKRFQEVIKKSEFVDWSKIESPDTNLLRDYNKLPENTIDMSSLASRLVVIKLNGGLGTSMGCVGPKSVIAAHNGKTFLDLTVEQIANYNKLHNTSIPLVLMNSFSTHDETQKIIEKYTDVRVLTFMQSQYPRIKQSDFLPVASTITSGGSAWYPPGHGDFYNSFRNSGLLDSLLKEGRDIAFISNVDNLGAIIDERLLGFMCANGPDFAMEVTAKTINDIKGGTIISYEGAPKLLEIAQVPPEHKSDFESVKQFKIFNTNNLWMNLHKVREAFDTDSFSNFDIIVNKKVADGVPVIQLETAIGAAIQCFKNSCAIEVPRSRFLPVKTTNELLLVQSDMFVCNNGTLSLSPLRAFNVLPDIRLGAKFKTVGEYLSRFGSIPKIIDLYHLTCVGDVSFGKNVELKGTVIITAQEGKQIHIEDNTVLENCVVINNENGKFTIIART